MSDWLRKWTPDEQRAVDQLAGLVRAADTRIEEAVKWKRLTFTVDGDWHHWLCGVDVTRRGVRLVLHKGSLLNDPANLLRGSGRYVRDVLYEDAIGHPEAVTALIEDGIAHQRVMLPAND
ncbi:MAG: DUF1801 domain-containing protein [Acidimicrobiales bacterium]